MVNEVKCTKTAFRTEKDVDLHIERLRKTSKAKAKIPVLRGYLCPKCHLWHMTSREPHVFDRHKECNEKIDKLEREVKILNQIIVMLKTQHESKEKKLLRKDDYVKELQKTIQFSAARNAKLKQHLETMMARTNKSNFDDVDLITG